MFYVKNRKEATHEMILALIERSYNEELPKTEGFLKEIFSNYKPCKFSLEEFKKRVNDSNAELLNNIEKYESQLCILTDLAIVLDDDYMPYISEEEYNLCLNYFIRNAPDLLLEIQQIIHLLKMKCNDITK